MRIGDFGVTSILPPRCSRNVRSETLCTSTPGSARTASTMLLAVIRVARVDGDVAHGALTAGAHEVDRAEVAAGLADRARRPARSCPGAEGTTTRIVRL